MNTRLLLDDIAKHVSLSEEDESYITSLLLVKKLKKRQYLYQEGDITKGPVFVTNGLLRSYSLDKNGFEHVIQFAPQHWWIGDMQSMVKQKPGKLYIDALEDTEILWMWKASLDKLYAQVPQMERFFRILAENAVAASQDRLIGHLSLPAIERHAHFCKLYPSLIRSLPQKQVASYIGVTPEFLSKMLNAGSK